jgi:hypothetical protein
MKNCIQGNLIIFTFSAIFTKWISRQSRAVSWLARFIKNEGKSVMNLLQKFSLLKNPAGKISKPSPLKGWRGLVIKNSGVFDKIPKGVNLLFLPQRLRAANPRGHWVDAN